VFRGNSLATRCVDEMMKIVGKHYLKVTLKPVIDEVGYATVLVLAGIELIFLSVAALFWVW